MSFSRGVHTSLEASKILSKHNINAEVIDLRSLRPIDFETIINSVKKTNNIITVEEGWLSSGLGAEIISRVSSEAFNYLDAPPLRIGALDVPLPYAKNLEEQSIPTAKRVAKECLYHLQNN